jgi:hypothetical protein
MGFYATQDYPNRKDKRKPGNASPSCNPHGSCPWCQGNRKHATRKRELSAEETRCESD